MLIKYDFKESIDDIKNCKLIYTCLSKLNKELFLYIYIPNDIFMIIIDLYFKIRNNLVPIPIYYQPIIDNIKFARLPKKYLKKGRYGHITIFLNDILNEFNFVVQEQEQENERKDKLLCFYKNNPLCDYTNTNCILINSGFDYWSKKIGELLSLDSRNSIMISDIKEKLCSICKKDMGKINNEDESLIYNEWLEITRECWKCHKNGCYECLQVCYTCCNQADLNYFNPICLYCNSNIKYKELKCGCEWKVCENCENDGCGQCYANYNYMCKMNHL